MERQPISSGERTVTAGDLVRLTRRAPGTRVDVLLQVAGSTNNESFLSRRIAGEVIQPTVVRILGGFTRPC